MQRWTCALALVLAFGRLPAQAPDEAIDARQIHWQRSLADALAVAQATGKPLFLAVNMDGESASDRIIRESYRDPAFVALTRRCVCLGASVFRHNARDHDDQGRRIECPRFGGITCGEHMALEPELFAQHLADGERVAPRHALVLQDGKKAFDLSLCFDLRDIDRALAAATAGGEAARLPPIDTNWAALAARRDANGRAALEAALATASDEATLRTGLAAIAERGDAGSLDALRAVAARLPDGSTGLQIAFAETTMKLGLADAVGSVLRGMVQSVGAVPADPGPDLRQRALLRALVALPHAGSESFLRATAAMGAIEGRAQKTVDVGALLQAAHAVPREIVDPGPGNPTDALPSEEELLQTLQRLDAEQAQRRGEAEWQAAFAKASLDLGRRHIETGARDAQLLLADAAVHFEKALEREPDRYRWWIEKARTAYFLQQFPEQVAAGERAFALTAGGLSRPPDLELLASPVLRDERAVEALRWIGDGHARQLAERAGKEAEVEIGGIVDGLRALGIAAASPFGHEKDWISLGSFVGAVGLRRQEVAVYLCAAQLFPASREMRQALNAALWNCGRPDLSGAVAEQIVRSSAPLADADWFAGYAWILVAEDARRRERPRAAVDAYDTARRWFASAATQNAAYRDNCELFTAIAQVGRGHALAQAGERGLAAGALVAALPRRELPTLRDGLGYDVLDLVDRITEWRDDESTPVSPMVLLDHIDAVVADDPFWAAAVSDSALREALRADGRNPDRAMQKTVDAAGNEIMMPMGRPTEEGDMWLLAAVEAGRRAAARARTDDDKQPLLQSATIQAERLLERGRLDGVRELLAEAAAVLGWDAPADGADEAALRAFADRLRSRLGPARPRLREGR